MTLLPNMEILVVPKSILEQLDQMHKFYGVFNCLENSNIYISHTLHHFSTNEKQGPLVHWSKTQNHSLVPLLSYKSFRFRNQSLPLKIKHFEALINFNSMNYMWSDSLSSEVCMNLEILFLKIKPKIQQTQSILFTFFVLCFENYYYILLASFYLVSYVLSCLIHCCAYPA